MTENQSFEQATAAAAAGAQWAMQQQAVMTGPRDPLLPAPKVPSLRGFLDSPLSRPWSVTSWPPHWSPWRLPSGTRTRPWRT